MDGQPKSHMKNVPRHATTTIPDNSVGLRKYIITEKLKDQSKTTDVELNDTTNIVNNNIWLGENIEQNPRNQDEKNENNKTEAVKSGDATMKMEEDDDDDMSWPELFAWELKYANRGELIKEEDIAMISTNNKDLLKEYFDFNK